MCKNVPTQSVCAAEGVLLFYCISLLVSMARLPQAKRVEIQRLHKLHVSLAEIARALDASRKSVRCWASRGSGIHSTDERPRTQGHFKLDRKASRSAYTLLMNKKHSGARNVARVLRQKMQPDVSVSKDTVISSARRHAATRKEKIKFTKGKPQQALSQQHKDARVAFCIANKRRDWRKVMFTDRKRFYLRYPGSKVHKGTWVIVGQKPQAFTASSPLCLNVYLGITPYGATACHFVSGTSGMKSKYKTKSGSTARNICTSEYFDVVHDTLLPQGDKIFNEHGVHDWVLQQDGDRSHAKPSRDALDAYSKQHKHSRVSILPVWPACSPDLSPIENFWAVLQEHVNRVGCRTLASFKKQLKMAIKGANAEWFDNYYISMPKRLSQCIAKNGERISF